MAAHPERRGTRLGQRQDGLATQVVGGEQGAHGDGLVDAAELAAREVGVECDELGALGFEGDGGHLLNRLDGELARSGLGREHHGVGAVEHSVGHVGHLGAVGTGLTIMDSIICVAVMATLSRSRAILIMRFCSAGTAALPTSRQVAASDHDAVRRP